MPLFDDPVEATVSDQPVLWLGTDHAHDGDKSVTVAVIVGEGGDVSVVPVAALRANFRHVNGRWLNVDDQGAAEAAGSAGFGHTEISENADPTVAKYPPGTIFDKEGNPYTADGDPL